MKLGIDRLLEERLSWISGRRIALLTHPAALSNQGVHTANRLHSIFGSNLTCLFGPEHGFAGAGDPGEEIPHECHPEWDIPVHSLYGQTRKVAPDMLDSVDVIICDLQDLGVRCFTYVSTLRYLLESAAEQGIEVIICDRPIPEAVVVDGPMLDTEFQSFVACAPLPLKYAMSQGEVAALLCDKLNIDVSLRVASMQGYSRQDHINCHSWAQWCPPSPAIRSMETALCYPTTVICEALPAIDCWRSGLMPFQVVGAAWDRS